MLSTYGKLTTDVDVNDEEMEMDFDNAFLLHAKYDKEFMSRLLSGKRSASKELRKVFQLATSWSEKTTEANQEEMEEFITSMPDERLMEMIGLAKAYAHEQFHMLIKERLQTFWQRNIKMHRKGAKNVEEENGWKRTMTETRGQWFFGYEISNQTELKPKFKAAPVKPYEAISPPVLKPSILYAAASSSPARTVSLTDNEQDPPHTLKVPRDAKTNEGTKRAQSGRDPEWQGYCRHDDCEVKPPTEEELGRNKGKNDSSRKVYLEDSTPTRRVYLEDPPFDGWSRCKECGIDGWAIRAKAPSNTTILWNPDSDVGGIFCSKCIDNGRPWKQVNESKAMDRYEEDATDKDTMPSDDNMKTALWSDDLHKRAYG